MDGQRTMEDEFKKYKHIYLHFTEQLRQRSEIITFKRLLTK